jgi:hypothetical protein
MKGVIISNLAENHRKKNFSLVFAAYLIIPLRSGLYGFAIFFTALLLVKSFLLLITNQNDFTVNVNDVALSLIGFASFYIIRIFQNIKNGKQLN